MLGAPLYIIIQLAPGESVSSEDHQQNSTVESPIARNYQQQNHSFVVTYAIILNTFSCLEIMDLLLYTGCIQQHPLNELYGLFGFTLIISIILLPLSLGLQDSSNTTKKTKWRIALLAVTTISTDVFPLIIRVFLIDKNSKSVIVFFIKEVMSTIANIFLILKLLCGSRGWE